MPDDLKLSDKLQSDIDGESKWLLSIALVCATGIIVGGIWLGKVLIDLMVP